MTVKAAHAPPKAREKSTPRYRHDIDGLRAIAVLLVVIYHVWLGRVSGGVDAFLMISAFLLTGSLMRRLETTGKVKAAHQWVRNFKRMLPAAAITILATAIIGFFVLPASALPSLWRHSLASIFYVENWLLASEAVDYYASNALASPLQHFWSLSIQGQVFLLWPLLFLVIALVSRAIGRKWARTVAFVVFGLVFAASLAYSIVSTQTNQTLAYFDTFARLWEFAAGSILALVIPWIRLPVIPRAVLGWAGVAALIAGGMVLDVEGGFPGYLALWPVLSVAAVIISGNSPDRRYGPALLLETKPVLTLGRSSYALYLVHWPLLVFTLVWFGIDRLSGIQGLALIIISIVLAHLLTITVDAPLRRAAWVERSPWRGAIVIAVSVALVVFPTVNMQQTADAETEAALQQALETPDTGLGAPNPGAAVLFDDWDGNVDATAPARPLAAEVETQWGTLAHNCSDGSLMELPDTVEICFDNGNEDADTTVIVIGNSHAQQILEPIGAVADAEGWRAISFLYAACAFGLRDVDEDRGIFYSQECRDWNEDVLDLIEEIDPAAVITIGTETVPTPIPQTNDTVEGAQSDPDSADEAAAELDEDVSGTDDEIARSPSGSTVEVVLDGVEESIKRLERLSIPVVLIRDNPRFTENAYLCAEISSDPAAECAIPREDALAKTNPAARLASETTAVIDLSDYFCPGDSCPAIIGNTYVYIDDNHLSLVYAATLAPVLDRELVSALTQFGAIEPTMSTI